MTSTHPGHFQRWAQDFGNKSTRLFSFSLYLGENAKNHFLPYCHKQAEWDVRLESVETEKMSPVCAEPSLIAIVKRFKPGVPLPFLYHCRSLVDVSGKNKHSQSQPKCFLFLILPVKLRQNPNSTPPPSLHQKPWGGLSSLFHSGLSPLNVPIPVTPTYTSRNFPLYFTPSSVLKLGIHHFCKGDPDPIYLQPPLPWYKPYFVLLFLFYSSQENILYFH